MRWFIFIKRPKATARGVRACMALAQWRSSMQAVIPSMHARNGRGVGVPAAGETKAEPGVAVPYTARVRSQKDSWTTRSPGGMQQVLQPTAGGHGYSLISPTHVLAPPTHWICFRFPLPITPPVLARCPRWFGRAAHKLRIRAR